MLRFLRRRVPRTRVVLAACLLGTGVVACTYGNSPLVSVTPISPYEFESRVVRPELFFGQKAPERAYDQIALVEVTGARASSTAELADMMRARAHGLGADAVVEVTTLYRDRETGDLLLTFLGDEDEGTESYAATVLRGIAVRYRDE